MGERTETRRKRQEHELMWEACWCVRDREASGMAGSRGGEWQRAKSLHPGVLHLMPHFLHSDQLPQHLGKHWKVFEDSMETKT